MKRTKILSVLALGLTISMFLTGCSLGRFETGFFHKEEPVEEEEKEDGYIYGETSQAGIDEKSKDFYTLLTDNSYYVIHDGVWYPSFLYYTNYNETEAVPEQASGTRIACFNEEYDSYIPTLYKGDKLVYYSTQNILDYTTFERYKDLGWTFPILQYSTITDGRLYLYLKKGEEKAKYVVLPECPYYTRYNKDNDVYIYIDKINQVSINSDQLNEAGLFDSQYLNKGESMAFDCYAGSVYEYQEMRVDTHAFVDMEIFAQSEFIGLQLYTYEIPIPDYLPSGYYMVNNSAFIRYVADDENRYSEIADWNEPILFPEQEAGYGEDENVKYIWPFMYSENPDLNLYAKNQTAQVGTLGYVDENALAQAELESKVEEAKKQFGSNYSASYYFEMPEKRNCKVTITSSSGEKTGSVKLTFSTGRVINIKYDMFTNSYTYEFEGKGGVCELYVAGLFDDYNIEVTNLTQISSEDFFAIVEPPTEENAKEEPEAPAETTEEPVEQTENIEEPSEPVENTEDTENTEAASDTEG